MEGSRKRIGSFYRQGAGRLSAGFQHVAGIIVGFFLACGAWGGPGSRGRTRNRRQNRAAPGDTSMKTLSPRLVVLVAGLLPVLARAADMDGAQLSVLWSVPFAGILLSIAIMPLVAPFFWHHHFGKVSAAWALAFLIPFAIGFGPGVAGASIVHALLAEYIPFIILLTALFTVAGGIYIRGNLHGAPGLNTGILALGTGLASIMGTTGAAMLLIRPLIRANDNRRHKAHVVIFFIFLVGNIGGSLSPLGEPPPVLGFLKGVDFFWPARAMFLPMMAIAVILLMLFYAVDYYFYHHGREERP